MVLIMNRKTVRHCKVWDILLVIAILIGIALLMGNAFTGNEYYWELRECKALTYLLVVVLFTRIIYRMLAGKKKLTKYMIMLAGGILLTVGVFFFNNALLFWGYASMFDYPADFLYKTVLIDDLQHPIGIGIKRYIFIFVSSLVSFVLIEEGIVRKVSYFMVKASVKVIELTEPVLERLGLLRLFGLEYEMLEDASEERNKLIKILQENDNISIHKNTTDHLVDEYVVKLPKKQKNVE
jgi:hypothetical protein